MRSVACVGLDVYKQTISYCVKVVRPEDTAQTLRAREVWEDLEVRHCRGRTRDRLRRFAAGRKYGQMVVQ